MKECIGSAAETLAASPREANDQQIRLQIQAVESTANAVIITDMMGKISWVNPAFTKVTGYKAEEVVGKNPRILKSGRHSDRFYKDLWNTISAGKVWQGEMVNRHKDGRLYDEEMTITPVRDARGVVSHFIAIKNDITHRKKTEMELRWKTALFEAQVHSALDGILVVDEQGEQIIKNERFNEVWKIPQSLVAQSNDRLSLQYAMNQTKNPKQFIEKVDYLYSHPDELSRDLIELNDGTVLDRYSAPVKDKAGKYYGRIWTFRDVTEQKRAESSMRELHEQVVESSRVAGMAEVATSILHNVGNVLNSINVAATLLEDHARQSRSSDLNRLAALLGDHAADLGEFLTQNPRGKMVPQFITKLAERLTAEHTQAISELSAMRQHIEHIKNIVAMQQGLAKNGGVFEIVNPADLLEAAVQINEGSMARRDITVIREYGPAAKINTDRHKVLQILVNLLSNAKQACEESMTARKQVTVRLTEDSDSTVFSIIDNGIGITTENLKCVFNHGFTTRKDGHGFGLHSGALAAKQLGGSLSVSSNGPGTGACFALKVPKTVPIPQ